MATQNITVSVSDVNEFAPVLDDASFGVAENTENGTTVRTMTATDEDVTKTFSYSLTSGNGLGIFAINSMSCVITLR